MTAAFELGLQPDLHEAIDRGDTGYFSETAERASAAAAAGTATAGVQAQFQDGIAYYQITESGLIASADIAGTKYFKHKKLNDE